MGGETAEMPGHYKGANFDLAGFSVGCVDEDKILTNKTIESGNILLGIESSGPHSNGFSLIRKIIDDSSLSPDEYERITEMALKPTHLYPDLIMNLLSKHKINGMAHITGGGLTENIPRSIPNNLSVTVDKSSWEMPEIFQWLKKNGDIIEIDAEKGSLKVQLTNKELIKRKKIWKPKKIEYNSGTLWKYSQSVGPAFNGAVTHPGASKGKKSYADI